jgi:hypothetical protein
MHMMNSSLFHEVYMMYAEAYAPNIVAQLKQKFRDQDAEVSDEVMEWYINRFNAIKDSVIINNYARRVYKIEQPRDILNYSWNQLETVVDQMPAPDSHPQGQQAPSEPAQPKIIYNENGLRIYDAPNKLACIHLGQREFGKTYNFCVSRPGEGNLYASYRYKMRSFYFVYDETLPANDINHLLVIQIANDARYWVTTANNPGDKLVSWKEIEKMQPKLEGLQHLFKFHDFSRQEKASLSVSNATSSTFDFLNYERKAAYIAMEKTISLDSWMDLPRDLKKAYADAAASRKISRFFAFNNATILQNLNPVQILKDNLPQEATRYASRVKQNYELSQEDNEKKVVQGIEYYVEKLDYDVTKALLQDASAGVRGILQQLESIMQRRNVPLGAGSRLLTMMLYDTQTMMYMAMGLRFSFNSSSRIDFIIKDGELMQSSITFESSDEVQLDDAKAVIKTIELLNNYNVEALIEQQPQVLEALIKSDDVPYARRLYSKCIIDDVMLDGELYARFMKHMMKNVDHLSHDGLEPEKNILNKLQQSQLFKQLIQRRNETAKGFFVEIESPQTAFMVILHSIATYKHLHCAFDEQGNLLTQYTYLYKVHGYSPPMGVWQRRENVEQLPEYLKKIYNADGATEYQNAAAEVEQLKQRRLRTQQRKSQSATKSAAAKHFLHLKAMGRTMYEITPEYREYIQEHGVRNEIKMGRKVLISNQPVFIGQYADTSMILSAATLDNLAELARGYNIAWNKIYIQPIHTRVAFSFFIQGKNEDDEDVYYCRKEFNSQGAGQTFFVNINTNEQTTVSSMLRHLRRGE